MTIVLRASHRHRLQDHSHGHFRGRGRRGAALILALAALLILASASVALASIAARTKLARSADESIHAADDLLRAAEVLVFDWLKNESATVILPADSESPHVLVMHAAWNHEGVDHEIRVVAWDQCGMVSLGAARAGSPLRMTLPQYVLEVLDAAQPLPASAAAGLDVFARPFDERAPSPFPRPSVSEPTLFDGTAHAAASELPARREGGPSAIGGLLSTHAAAINVNTAPLPLVEQALRLAGRGGFDLIVASRSQGKQVSIGALPSAAAPPSDMNTPMLIASSDVWAFRLDARVGSVQRSMWRVYERSTGRHGGGQRRSGTNRLDSNPPNHGWECIQSIVIRD